MCKVQNVLNETHKSYTRRSLTSEQIIWEGNLGN